MSHCVLTSTPEFRNLFDSVFPGEKFENPNVAMLAASVAVWQVENGLDKYPTRRQLGVVNPVWEWNRLEGQQVGSSKLVKSYHKADLEYLQSKFPGTEITESTDFKGRKYYKAAVSRPGQLQESTTETTEIKLGVSELFENNPELAKIGTAEQYSNYLDTIFPDSKVKDIVYHGTDTTFDEFLKDKINSKESTSHAKGFYFGWAGSHGSANVYVGNFGRGKKVMLLNKVEIQNPYRIYGSFAPIKNNPEFVEFLIRNGFDITQWKYYPNGDIFDYTSKIGNDKITEALKKEGYDSVIVDKGGWKTIERNKELGNVESNSDELIVFEPEQIHILGNKQDIQGFKEFVSKEEQSLQPEQLSIEFGVTNEAIEFNDSIDNAVDNNEPVTLNKEEVSYKIQEDVLNRLKGEEKILAEKIFNWLNKLGIRLESMPTADKYGVDVIAYAHMVEGVIRLVEGSITINQLAEEASHFLLEMLGEEHPLYKAMYNKIESMSVYAKVYDKYQDKYLDEEGNPDINKIKKEAMAQALAQIISDTRQETQATTKFGDLWVTKLINWLRSKFFKGNIEQLKEDISEFKTAASMLIGEDVDSLLTLKDIQESWKQKENPVFFHQGTNKRTDVEERLNQTKKRVTYNPNIKSYIKDGTELIKKRVHDLVEKFKTERFGYRVTSKETEKDVEVYAKKGTLLHKYLQIITDKLFKKEAVSQAQIEAIARQELQQTPDFKEDKPYFFELTTVQFSELQKAMEYILGKAQEYQNIIDPNETIKVFTEAVIYQDRIDQAGTIDLLILLSDGSALVYDFKSMQMVSRRYGDVEPIPLYKLQQYDIQLSEYSRMLLDVYGVSRIVEARAVPIRVTFNPNIDYGFKSIEMGAATKTTYREYLEDIPMFSEETGIKSLDTQLKKLNNLRLNLLTELKNNYNKDLLIKTQRLSESIKALQVRRDAEYSYREIASLIDNFEKRKVLSKEDPKSLTWEDINEMKELLEIYSDFFQEILDDQLEIEDPKDKEQVELQYSRLIRKIALLKRDVYEMIKSRFLEETSVDITKPTKEGSWLGRYFKRLSEFTRGHFKILSDIIQRAEVYVLRQLETDFEIIQNKTNDLERWAKARGMSIDGAFDMIYKNGNLVNKYSGVFGKEKREAIKNEDLNWFAENTNIIVSTEGVRYVNLEDQKKFEELKKRTFEKIDKRYDPKLEAFLNEREKARWEYYHDFMENPRALFRSPYYMKNNENPRFFSKEWLEMSKPGNESLKAYYEMYVQYNRKAAEITGKPIEDTFVAEVQRDLIDNIATNGISGITKLRQIFWQSLEVREQDIAKGSFDTATGESIPTIPLLYTTPITRNLKSSEIQTIKDSINKNDFKTEKDFERELARRIYEKEREEGIKLKSKDLSQSLYRFLASAYNMEYMKDKEDMILALKASMRDPSLNTQMTTLGGKGIMDKFGRKVLEKLGVPADEAAAFDAFVNKYLYGQNLQGKGMGTFIGKSGKTYSVDKIARLIMKYIALKGLGLSPIVAAGNSIQTFQSLAVKAAEEQFISKKGLRKAQEMLFTNNEKTSLIAGYFKPFSFNITFKEANKLSARGLSRYLTDNNAFFMMEQPDRIMDILLSVAMLEHFGIDENGTIVRLDKLKRTNPDAKSILDSIEVQDKNFTIPGITDNENNFIQLRRMMQTVSVKTKGMMSVADQSLIGTNIYLAVFMQFRNWIPPLLKDRFGKIEYDDALSTFNQGRYNVWFGEFSGGLGNKLKAFSESLLEVAAFGAYNRYKKSFERKDFESLSIAKKYYDRFLEANLEYEGKLTFEDYVELRMNKVQGMARELRGLLAYALLILLLKSMGDDEDKKSIQDSLLTDNLYRLSNRGLLEMSFFLDPGSALQILSNPAVSFRLVKDFKQLGDRFIKYTFETDPNKSDKAQRRLIGKTISMIPGTRLVFDVVDFTTMFDE